MNPVLLFNKFEFLKDHKRLNSDFSGARIMSMTSVAGGKQLDFSLSLTQPVPPYEIALIEELIADEFGFDMVNIHVTTSNPGQGDRPVASASQDGDFRVTATASKKTKADSTPVKSVKDSSGNKKAILGRITKVTPKPISDVTLDDGRVTIRGFVCAVRSRFIERNNSYLLSFDITDYTGTINVTKFMQDNNARKVTDAIKEGLYLTVSGTLGINRYDQEICINPQNIYVSEHIERTDDAPVKRVELHLHTRMSALDGLTGIGEVVKRAAKWGHRAIAITDHGVVHAFPDAAAAAKKASAKGHEIKIIYGLEGYFRDGEPPLYFPPSGKADPGTDGTDNTNSGFDGTGADDSLKSAGASLTKTKSKFFHIILLVKNRTGLKNLYKLVSKSHIECFYKRPLIYRNILKKYRNGLIVGSACESGELFRAVVEGKKDDELFAIAQFYDYLEIQPVCNNMFMILSEKMPAKSIEDLRSYNRKIVEIGEALDIPVVATTDAHFLDPEHEIFRKIILASKNFDSAREDLPLYFRTTKEMLEEFSYLGEEKAYEVVVTNPNNIAEMCEAISPLPPDKQFFPPSLEGSADDLVKKVYGRIPELYGESPPALITERVEAELRDILGRNYDVIYMTAQRLVEYLNNAGSRVGSRGSVGSSFVAHLAGITEVNPLPGHYRCPVCKRAEFPADMPAACGADLPDKVCEICGGEYLKEGFNIPFETFLGFDGEKIPDIDLNISGDYQDMAQKFIYDMFGDEYVYRAGTIGTIKEKNAYRMVKSFLEEIGRHVTKAEENRLIAGCLGVKQTTGQHPGGLIVIPAGMDVTDFCPVQHPADDKDKGIITTHFDYHKMEDHLIKLDMLGHDNPTMLVMLERLSGVNADDIRLDDPDTISVFSSPAVLGLPEDDDIIGETGAIGIPEFGTPFVRQMLCDTRPRDFDTLVRLSGYSHGTDVWLGNARELIASGTAKVSDTISSRDDIMLYLISVGMKAKRAFKVSESVRKGRGIPEGLDDEMRALRVPEWYIDSCNKIGYLFPKAHAVAYVIMAFRIAWFKVHRPLEYYSAHFYRRSRNNAFDAYSMTGGIDKVRAKIREIKGFKENTKKDEELLASLESCYEFYLRGFDFAAIDLYLSDAERFLPASEEAGKSRLRPPFVAVSGLGSSAAHSLAKHREGHEFISIEEISAVCPGVNKNHIEELMRLGALRDLPESSQMSLF